MADIDSKVCSICPLYIRCVNWFNKNEVPPCANAVVENINGVQQLQAKIAALIAKVDTFPRYNIPGPVAQFIEGVRQLSVVQ
jgi:hypothetical protein